MVLLLLIEIQLLSYISWEILPKNIGLCLLLKTQKVCLGWACISLWQHAANHPLDIIQGLAEAFVFNHYKILSKKKNRILQTLVCLSSLQRIMTLEQKG